MNSNDVLWPAGNLKTAIETGIISEVRRILDRYPDLMDRRLDCGSFPHVFAMNQQQYQIAECIADEYQCAAFSRSPVQCDKDSIQKLKEHKNGFWVPQTRTPLHVLQFIEDIENECTAYCRIL